MDWRAIICTIAFFNLALCNTLALEQCIERCNAHHGLKSHSGSPSSTNSSSIIAHTHGGSNSSSSTATDQRPHHTTLESSTTTGTLAAPDRSANSTLDSGRTAKSHMSAGRHSASVDNPVQTANQTKPDHGPNNTTTGDTRTRFTSNGHQSASGGSPRRSKQTKGNPKPNGTSLQGLNSPTSNATTNDGHTTSAEPSQGRSFAQPLQTSGATETKTITSIAPLDNGPIFSQITTTVSGSAITPFVIPGVSSSGITLTPASSGLLQSTDPTASSSAAIFGSKLNDAIEQVQSFQQQVQSNPGLAPPTDVLNSALSFSKGLLEHLAAPGSGSSSGECTSGLFSLISCAVSDIAGIAGAASNIADGVSNGASDVGSFVSHLGNLAGAIGGIATGSAPGGDPPGNDPGSKDPGGNGPEPKDPGGDDPNPQDPDDPDPGEDEPTSSDSPPSSDSTVSSSSSCRSTTTVEHVTSVCFNTTIATSTVETCTPRTKTITGCDISALTTTITLSSSPEGSVVAAPAMTYFYHPAEPTDDAGMTVLAEDILSQLHLASRLPIVSSAPNSSPVMPNVPSASPSHATADPVPGISGSTTFDTSVFPTSGPNNETTIPTKSGCARLAVRSLKTTIITVIDNAIAKRSEPLNPSITEITTLTVTAPTPTASTTHIDIETTTINYSC